MPWVFVLIWSTGFIVARYAMPHAPPLTFLCWRYALSILAFALWAHAAGVAWPSGRQAWFDIAVVGVFIHAGYLGGVWSAVKAGLPAGTVALIVGLQPVLTAVWSSGRGHHGGGFTQWLGLLLGLLGVGMVVWHKLGVGEVTPGNLAAAVLALAAITIGTLYQKWRARTCDVRSANCIQLMAALVVSLPFAAFESGGMDWGMELGLALAWSVLALTLGGSSLLLLLIQRGAATQVTSYLYLVPPCTAVMALAMFDEPLTWLSMFGMALCAGGVGLVLRSVQPVGASSR